MSGEPEPAAVKLARTTHAEIGQVCGAVVGIADEVRVLLELIANALEVELPPRRESEGIAWARARAAATDQQQSIERIREQMAESKRAARRQSALPSHDIRHDGSRARLPDPDWAATEMTAFLAASGNSQVARHAKLAASGRAPMDVGDAHAGTRKEREAIYAALAKDGRQR